jgi:hypothetical protein
MFIWCTVLFAWVSFLLVVTGNKYLCKLNASNYTRENVKLSHDLDCFLWHVLHYILHVLEFRLKYFKFFFISLSFTTLHYGRNSWYTTTRSVPRCYTFYHVQTGMNLIVNIKGSVNHQIYCHLFRRHSYFRILIILTEITKGKGNCSSKI